jgi:competence ComEA-like helix-hairpin-helix protein
MPLQRNIVKLREGPARTALDYNLGMNRLSLATLLIVLALSAGTAAAQPRDLPDGPGKALVLRVCQGCHAPQKVMTRHHNKEEWEKVIVDMVTAGATGTDEEFDTIVDYLAKNFPPKVNVNKAPAASLVETLGITASEADAIVAYREKNGAFKVAEDLKKVEGVDFKKIDAVKDRLSF